MAYTVSTVTKGVVFGNQLVRVLNITADAATQAVVTGLNVINHVGFAPTSCATNPVLKINVNASGTAADGTLGISGTTSGNTFVVTVYGR